MLWAFLGQRFFSRRFGGFIYLKPYRTMASRIPVNSPQITFPSFLYFPFTRSVITIWLLFNRYCIKLRLTDFLFFSHACEVLALDIILYLTFFFSLLFVPVSSCNPSTLEHCGLCVGSLLGTLVFVRVYLCCAVAIRLYVDIFLNPKYLSR
jgi:hypothetical protein